MITLEPETAQVDGIVQQHDIHFLSTPLAKGDTSGRIRSVR